MRWIRCGIASLLAAVAAALCAGVVLAQDSHYWNSQYGPRSMLLGGAVIGSVRDMSATYYNPGALGSVEEPELLVSANVYQTSTITVRDGAGEGIDLKTTNFNILPNMLAGAFRQSWLGKNKFAYSLLTRHRFKTEIQGSKIGREDVLPGPQLEEFAGGLSFLNDASELWAGLTWARGLGAKTGIGVTQYFSMRRQDQVWRLLAQASNDSALALRYEIDNFAGSVYSLLWKVGLGLDLSPVSLGLTLTTPNVRLGGSGESVSNSTWVGVDMDGDGTPDEGFEANVQEGVRANYESPLSVGVGAALHWDKTKIHAAAEWFDGVAAYDFLELESFRSQATDSIVQPHWRQKLDSVLNFAVGLEQQFGSAVVGYLSFTSDLSAFNPESDVTVTEFDIYHVTGGATLGAARTRFMLGLSYAWGRETTQQIIDLNPEEDDSIFQPGEPVDIEYDRFTFILGFSVSL